MDEQLFNHGDTPEQFIKNMEVNREKFDQHLTEVELNAEQSEKLAHLPPDLHVMVIAEDWSGDVLYFLPVFFKIAERKGWDVRIFRRDQYPDLILPYRKQGLYHSIPVYVFFDQDFKEVATWIERPQVATQVIDEESLKFRRKLREDYKAEWRQATIEEILDLELK